MTRAGLLGLLLLAPAAAQVPVAKDAGNAQDEIAAGASVLVAKDARDPQVAIAPDGTVFVVLLQGGDVRVTASRDYGKTFSEPVVAIDARGHARGGMQRGPRIAVDGKGRVYVSSPLTFDKKELQKKFPIADLWLAVSEDGGRKFGAPRQVNDADKKAPEALHWLGVATDGTVHLAWLDLRNGSGQQLAWRRIDEAGSKPQPTVLLEQALCDCCAPGLAVADGTPWIAFREGGAKRSRELFFTSPDGGKLSTPRPLNTRPTRVPS